MLLAGGRQGQRAIHTLLRQIEPAGQQVRLALHGDSQGRVQPPVDAAQTPARSGIASASRPARA